MKVLVAPDSFKGSATAEEIGRAMKTGILQADGHHHVDIMPMADGGEGTMRSLLEASNGQRFSLEVLDALGRQVTASYGVLGDNQTAVVELASASGIERLTSEERDPLVASSFGTGQLIMHALQQGIREFVICLGGSATNDAGTGLLKALGFRFLDAAGYECPEGGGGLRYLHMIDDTNVPAKVRSAHFHVACDVTNPLIGENGASAVFGPQKGASPERVDSLDDALHLFADRVQDKTGVAIHHVKGAGAAGGTSGGMLGLLSAELKSGFQVVADTLHISEFLHHKQPDMILTGEGQLDGQTAAGKVIAGLSSLGQSQHVPVFAIVGSVSGQLQALHDKGLTAAFSMVNQPMTLAEAMEQTLSLVTWHSEQLMRTLAVTAVDSS